MISCCKVKKTDVSHNENTSSLGCPTTHDSCTHHKADDHHHGEAAAKHECPGLKNREPGACCKSHRKECCGGLQGCDLGGGLGGLTEIITE